MKTYECIPAFGWGISGLEISSIRRKLRELGLKNEHPPYYPKIHELIAPFPVRVTGDNDVVDEFESYMKNMGHDDR